MSVTNAIQISCDGDLTAGRPRFTAISHDPRTMRDRREAKRSEPQLPFYTGCSIPREVGLPIWLVRTTYHGNPNAGHEEQKFFNNDVAANLTAVWFYYERRFEKENVGKRPGSVRKGWGSDGASKLGRVFVESQKGAEITVQHVEVLCDWCALYRIEVEKDVSAAMKRFSDPKAFEEFWKMRKAEKEGVDKEWADAKLPAELQAGNGDGNEELRLNCATSSVDS
ncbi:uncharacterized protein KY384_003405 [Bacidia gigantensis]|uniref:uncharacterized protein n=1 Tax=Bacidia gigantensis TaxID=2732470 RepID=UPI001D040E69|nr:uncharacterized protein KY384_003405 [Bacidia gigantensis]KAG8531769.1 hypothetical protein KY384_003405 [Bacidia gigantensis]